MAASRSLISLDGAHGEGGGALVRTAIALSSITQQPCRILQPRGATKRPGLVSEDAAVCKLLAEACGAELTGLSPDSRELVFAPSKPMSAVSGRLVGFKPEEEASSPIALIGLATLAPILSRTASYCEIEAPGETYGAHVLSYDYFANVTARAWKRCGLYVFPKLELAGYGRGSQGEVFLEVEPSVFHGFNWETRGSLKSIGGLITTSDLPPTVAQRGLAHLKRLSYYAGVPLEAYALQVPSRTPGAFVTLWAEYENGLGGSTAMGVKGLRVEAVAQSAFDSLMLWTQSGATVDHYLADQLILPAVLANEPCKFSTPMLTERLATIIWVVKQFLPIHITVRGQIGEPATIAIEN